MVRALALRPLENAPGLVAPALVGEHGALALQRRDAQLGRARGGDALDERRLLFRLTQREINIREHVKGVLGARVEPFDVGKQRFEQLARPLHLTLIEPLARHVAEDFGRKPLARNLAEARRRPPVENLHEHRLGGKRNRRRPHGAATMLVLAQAAAETGVVASGIGQRTRTKTVRRQGGDVPDRAGEDARQAQARRHLRCHREKRRCKLGRVILRPLQKGSGLFVLEDQTRRHVQQRPDLFGALVLVGGGRCGHGGRLLSTDRLLPAHGSAKLLDKSLCYGARRPISPRAAASACVLLTLPAQQAGEYRKYLDSRVPFHSIRARSSAAFCARKISIE